MGVSLIAVLVFWSCCYISDAAAQQFARQIQIGYEALAKCISPTQDSGFLIGVDAYKTDNFEGFYPPAYMKMDANGNIAWVKHLKTSIGVTNAIAPHPDGSSLLLSMDVTDFGGGSTLSKIDAQGEVLWSNYFSGIGADYFSTILRTADSGCILPVQLRRYIDGLIKIDVSGKVEWVIGFDSVASIIRTGVVLNDGSLILGLLHHQVNDSYFAELVKLSPGGAVDWCRQFPLRTELHSIKKTSDGDFVICGWNDDYVFVAKFNSAGIMLWGNNVDTYGSASAYAIAEAQNGDLLLCGRHDTGALFIRTDVYGTVISATKFSPASKWCRITDVLYRDGRYFVTGLLDEPARTRYDIMVMDLSNAMENCHMSDLPYRVLPLEGITDSVTRTTHIDSVKSYFYTSGQTVTLPWTTTDLCGSVSVHCEKAGEPQLFPNPAKDVVHVNLNSPLGSTCTITVYDLLGVCLHNVETACQDNTIAIDVAGFDPGVYRIHVWANGECAYAGQFLKISE